MEVDSFTKFTCVICVSTALFMDALDTTILNTAIPAMAHSLQVNPVDLKIALISYFLSLALFIPISGWIGSKFGLKNVFIAALLIFTVSSFWCGAVTTLYELAIARSCQGFGGALMLPLGRLLMLRTFQRHELISAMNQLIIVISMGLMLGPLAGGFITDHFSWHWIFWVNIPIGIFNSFLASRWLKPTPPAKKIRSFDMLGFLLFGCGLVLLMFALSYLSESSSNTQTALLLICIAVLLLCCYFLYSAKQPHPIINTELFRLRTFSVSMFGTLFARLSYGGMPFLLPLLLQVGLGYSAQLSGLLLAPLAIGVVLVRAISLRMLRYWGFKRLLFITTLLVGAWLWTFITINQHTPTYLIACLTFFLGVLVSLQFSSVSSLGYADISSDELDSATSIISTMQQIAQSSGVAVAALLLRYFSIKATGKMEFLLVPAIFHQAFFALGILTCLAAVVFLFLKPNDGKQLLVKPVKES